jgi:hypothetical protein
LASIEGIRVSKEQQVKSPRQFAKLIPSKS